MLRSMYSAVSGIKTHQTKMDVIGNNIANVNTYGFKSSRATFSDVYYQTMSGSSSGSANQGGKDSMQIGYGGSVAGIDVMHSRSGFQMTDNGMDLAIAGEGFFQVQDGDGNIFYTRAGMIRIDATGNVVDQNGNFVLGVSGNPMGVGASSDKIQINVPSTNPQVSKVEQIINGLVFDIKAANPTRDGNISFNFQANPNMPLGEKAQAVISTTGINVTFNQNEIFTSMDDVNAALNAAITAANGGPHPAGDFTISVQGAVNFPLTGLELVGTNYKPTLGDINEGPNFNSLGFTISNVSGAFSGNGIPTFDVVNNGAAGYTISVDINGTLYQATFPTTATAAGQIKLVNMDPLAKDDFIIMDHKGYTNLNDSFTTMAPAWSPEVGTVAATPSLPSNQIGLSTKSFTLLGGTAGGTQSIADLTNIGIGPDGIITGMHAQLGLIPLGRLDLATFDNPQGLDQVGSTYFAVAANSGAAKLTTPGIGGAGSLQAGALEMSNVDLSKEFADMITTQRGFQASSRLVTVSDEILNELVNLKR